MTAWGVFRTVVSCAGAALAAAAIAACSSLVDGSAIYDADCERAGSRPAMPPSSAPPQRTPVTDPCEVVTWDDFPVGVRNVAWAPKPSIKPGGIRDCSFDNSDLGTISVSPTCPGSVCDYQPAMRVFVVHVSFGGVLAVDASSYDGCDHSIDEVSNVTIHGDLPGVLVRDTVEVGEEYGDDTPRCVVAFDADQGHVAVQISNSRFPYIDTCDSAHELAELVAARIEQ